MIFNRLIKSLVVVIILGLIITCSPPSMAVYVQMMPYQEAYFANEVDGEFGKKNRVKINVKKYESTDTLEKIFTDKTEKVALVKVPFDDGTLLMKKGNFIPLDSILPKEKLDEFKKEYLLMPLGALDGKQYFVPRKFETRIMAYSKSMVAEVVESWHEYKDQINTELSKYNGIGLPKEYLFEEDPEQWDYFDLFVVGWVWANREYNGNKVARIAHISQRYSNLSLRIIDRVFQLGGDFSQLYSMASDAVVDAFFWEAVYISSGILGSDVTWIDNKQLRQKKIDEVFLSHINQLDCFMIHETGYDSLGKVLKKPNDLGVATMPLGCSMDLDPSTGAPIRIGKKAISTGGWWWGIPKKSPDPVTSFNLLSYVTDVQMQVQECSRFGMIPVRKDVLEDIQMLFGGGWLADIYNVSLRQLMFNGDFIIGSDVVFDKISVLYFEAWNDIIKNRNWSPDDGVPSRVYIEKILNDKYAKKALEIARKNGVN